MRTLMQFAVVLALVVTEAHASRIFEPSTTTYRQLKSKDALVEFDQNLKRRFQLLKARVEVAYEVITPGLMKPWVSYYVVGRCANGDVLWLVKAAKDNGLTVSTLEALAYVPKRRWTQQVNRVRGYIIPMPIVSSFVPDDYVAARRSNVAAVDYEVVGSYFACFPGGCR